MLLDLSRPLNDKKLDDVVLSRPFVSIELISSGSSGCNTGLDALFITGLVFEGAKGKEGGSIAEIGCNCPELLLDLSTAGELRDSI